MKTASAIAAFVGVVAATSWGDYPSFKTPKGNDNKCEGQQQGGWGWGNLPSGGFGSYDGFDFSGFTCADRFGKRDSMTKRSFQQKVIQGSMSENDGPSFKCGAGKNFSPSKYQVSVSRDTDVEMHYSMPDGTTCKQTAKCKKDGSIVENKQCGGAKEVKFKLPQGSREKCDLGIHYVDFDCNGPPNPPKSSSAPPPPPSSSKPPTPPPASSTPGSPVSSSRPAPPPASSCAYGKKPDGSCSGPPASSAPPPPASSCAYGKKPDGSCSGPPSPSSSAPPPPASSAPPPPASSCAYGKKPDGSCSGPPPASSSAPPPPASSAPPPPASSCAYGKKPDGSCSGPPASSAPPPPASSAPPPPASSAPPPPASSCAYGKKPDGSCSGPPPASSTPGSPVTPSSSAPPPPPSSSCAYGKKPDGSCSGPPASSAPPPPPSSSAPPPPPPSSAPPPPPSSSTPANPPQQPPANNDCPAVLPQCLNTWIKDSGCKDNSDFTCFCKNGDFTKNVIQCVTAYGADKATIAKALSYLQGICAAFIPQNPGIVTDCPKDIPITPPAPVSNRPQPTDTITITTQVITETVSTCTPGQVVTDNGTPTTLSTSKTSTITVTQTATYTTCGKCGGAPANVPQYTTIAIADTYTVPCTYSEGVSEGYPIPGSSTITQLTTAVTVPVVGFVTAPPTPDQATPSVGFVDGYVPGAPAPAPAPGYGGAPTTLAPSASRTSRAPLQVTANAASKMNGGKVLGVLAGGALAVLVL